ncbi:Oidioi.mRNA.OKI2018_I69.XSR.g14152.t1.cds [Oikopleura dioica]|uniref:Tubulin-specific chaperone E n=1 Tax=Oikopleura dioica TaxID=34765 RepID=A0ABN7SDU9_OIKDI|nr:Oidioi.mRNA.OKI2018_I69.XSR.g14152.t1.cds [Oikopleura dioica]
MATVAYVGAIEGRPEDCWIGIVYVEPIGKHDGTHNGKRYFECAQNFGSFVKPSKIVEEMSLEEALIAQYERNTELEEKVGAMNSSALFLIETPTTELRSVSITDFPVVSLSRETILQKTPKCRHLDISNTKITSWKQVHESVEVTEIRELTASRMKLNSAGMENLAFQSIDSLILCNCDYDDEDLALLSAMFPNLKKLNLSGNRLSLKESKWNLPGNLTFLDLSDNKEINSWEELVNLLSKVQLSLEDLNISNCSLRNITSHEARFPKLTQMILSGNLIDNLECFSNLNVVMESLTHLSVNNISTVGEDNDDSRQEIIARMENLLYLNRSFIPATDADSLSTGAKLNTRRGAEIDYLNRKANEWYALTPGPSSEQFYKTNPRWKELVKKLGEPVQQVKMATTMESKMLKINLKSKSGECIEKELIKTTKIKLIQVMFKKLFKEKVKDGQLNLLDDCGRVFALDKSDSTLDDVNAATGDTIFSST